MGHTVTVQYEKKAIPAGVGRWGWIFLLVGALGVVFAYSSAKPSVSSTAVRNCFSSMCFFPFNEPNEEGAAC